MKSKKRPPTKGMINRLRIDAGYRGRFMHSISIFWAFLSMGLCHGMSGPTFPDLRQITRQDLDTGSWIYTSGSVGNLLGSLLGGILFSRFNRLLLIGLAIALSGVIMGVMPWCEWFPLMVVVAATGNLFYCILNIGTCMSENHQGEEGSMYMQALHFFFSVGGVVSPLLAKPFLAPITCVPYTEGNLTETPTHNGMNSSEYDNTTFSISCFETFGETRIHIPYLISGLVMFSGCIPFLMLYLQSDRTNKSVHDADRNGTLQRPVQLSVKVKILLTALLSAFMAFFWAVEDGFIAFLMTFCLRQLRWTKDDGSYASSSYWAAFSGGRFLGIFLAKRFSSICLLFTFTIFIIFSFVGLLIGSMIQNPILPWVFIPLSGFSMSVVFPFIFTWTDTRIMKVTGMIASLLMVSGAGSGMVSPLLFGYMMDNYSPLWYIYLLLWEVTMCLLLLGLIQITVRLFLQDTQNYHEMDEEQEVTLLSGQDREVTETT